MPLVPFPLMSDSRSSAPYRWIPDDHAEDTIVSSFRGFASFENSPNTDQDARDSDSNSEAAENDTTTARDLSATSFADSTFVSEIQRDREICSSCFLRTHDTIIPYSPRPSVRRGLVRYYKGRDETTTHVPSAATVARDPPRACDCGSIGGTTQRPLSKRAAIAAARNLSRTLTAKGVEHNPLLLVAIVTRRKRTPEHAGRDDRNFAIATSRALAATGESFADELGLASSTTPALPKPKSTSEMGGPLLYKRPTLVEEGER